MFGQAIHDDIESPVNFEVFPLVLSAGIDISNTVGRRVSAPDVHHLNFLALAIGLVCPSVDIDRQEKTFQSMISESSVHQIQKFQVWSIGPNVGHIFVT